MRLTGLHLLLTYQCTYECDHCFVWGSPEQSGTMTISSLRRILEQARELGTIEWIFFEGGEPFLYYPLFLRGAREAHELGFRVGAVSNGYWATAREDAEEWLGPFAGILETLSVSCDLYHAAEEVSEEARNARSAAEALGISTGTISIAQPEAKEAVVASGQLPEGESAVLFRGRAAEKLAPEAPSSPWSLFTECPCEDLREPGRVHLDPLGNVHLCQGISLGNVFDLPLKEICEGYHPETHPVVGPLLEGGPSELVRRHGLEHRKRYADACHICYEARRALRDRYPETLTPDQMYGAPTGS